MKSCIEWRKNFKYLSQIDEFNIDFKSNKDKQLLDFLDLYAITQRVNIRVESDVSDNDIQLIKAIAHLDKYNIAVCFNWDYKQATPENEAAFKEIKEANIPFYFSHPIWQWDELNGYMNLGVSDVYLTGPLCFDLFRVSRETKKRSIQTRCYVNICQSNWKESNSFKKFFIRPNDIDTYGEYVDIIEFWDSVDNQQLLYEIYFKDKEWDGSLREIIKGLNTEVNNYYILGKYFAEYRLKCRKECAAGDRCKICDKVLALAQSLEKSEDYEVFKKRKAKEQKEKEII